jgi:hypothetical protein
VLLHREGTVLKNFKNTCKQNKNRKEKKRKEKKKERVKKNYKMTNPTLSPTFSPTFSDEIPSTLVLGVGAGTFTILFFSFFLAIVWLLSATCEFGNKIAWRITSMLIYMLVLFILVFSPRESKYADTSEEEIKV